MIKKLSVLLIIFFLSGCAEVQKTLFVPSEIERYCQQIAGSSDDTDAMNTCIRQEQHAKDELSRMTIPPNIEKRCRQLSDSTGGSYQVMLTCVQQETSSKKRGK
jgi:uncharacterized protein YceK